MNFSSRCLRLVEALDVARRVDRVAVEAGIQHAQDEEPRHEDRVHNGDHDDGRGDRHDAVDPLLQVH